MREEGGEGEKTVSLNYPTNFSKPGLNFGPLKWGLVHYQLGYHVLYILGLDQGSRHWIFERMLLLI